MSLYEELVYLGFSPVSDFRLGDLGIGAGPFIAEWHSAQPEPTAAQLDGAALAVAQSAQIAALRTACANAITGGFSSSALGSAYSYPSDPISQANMNTIAGSPSGGSLWCESGGVWSLKPHTQAQAQAVLASFVSWLNACQSQLVTLTGEVQGATTVSAVQLITWTNP